MPRAQYDPPPAPPLELVPSRYAPQSPPMRRAPRPQQYDVDAWFRDFVHAALEMEWRDPVGVAAEQKARETYGSDVARERDDFDAGRHPFQTSR